jgi:hypothetical protein
MLFRDMLRMDAIWIKNVQYRVINKQKSVSREWMCTIAAVYPRAGPSVLAISSP